MKKKFGSFSTWVTKATGSSSAFFYRSAYSYGLGNNGANIYFSETWQLVINTGKTIITFLMIFVIQQSQNKDILALHLKLNELISASEFTKNRLTDGEKLTEEELLVIKK